MRKIGGGAMLTMMALLFACLAYGQTAPSKPVRFFTNSGGGSTIALAHVLSDKIRENTGIVFVVESRAGGSGAVGLRALKLSPNDGQTIGISFSAALTVNPIIESGSDIDPFKDFSPITNLVAVVLVIAARQDFPAGSLNDLIEMAKAKPDTIKFAGSSVTNTMFLATLQDKLKVKFVDVPFKTSADSASMVLGGQVDVYSDLIGTVLPLKGKIKALAYGGPTRTPKLPGVQTIREVMPGVDLLSWFGLLGPAGMSSDRISWFHREFVKALRSPQVMAVLEKNGMEPIGDSPDEFAKSIRAEFEQSKDIIRRFGIGSTQ